MEKSLGQWLDKVFGNNDGKFNAKDLPNGAPGIVLIVVDVLMFFAEYRVYSAGYKLTNDPLLSLGFVAVSSVPFYLGQLAWLYNKANWIQQLIAVFMIGGGLLTSGFFGFTDYIISTVNASANVYLSYDAAALYEVATYATIALIIGGLLYGFFDDEIANRIKENRLEGRARIAEREMGIKERLLTRYAGIKQQEDNLRVQYGSEEVDVITRQFTRKGKAENPTDRPGS